ncbi:MAG: hypothetical protein JSS39_14490 [Nitrospira sp.]|nr:hypothetical protein [Nitrospira sp.]
MGKTGGGNPRRPITVSFTQEELDAMARFLEENPIIHSRSKLANVAIKYYMQQVEQSGGRFDSTTVFPVPPANDPPAQPEPVKGRGGPITCQIHRVIMLKAGTCHLCAAEAL